MTFGHVARLQQVQYLVHYVQISWQTAASRPSGGGLRLVALHPSSPGRHSLGMTAADAARQVAALQSEHLQERLQNWRHKLRPDDREIYNL